MALWDFEIIADQQYENVNHIHPLKQKDVSVLIQDIEKDPHDRTVKTTKGFLTDRIQPETLSLCNKM